MAGVKVTDLTALGTAATDDVMYIVDTSSNQSKKIEVQNIFSGLPQFESGAFTTVPSNEVNCTVTPINTTYIRVNDIVNCTFFIQVNLAPTETQGSFELSLPVASDFTQAKQLVGIVSHDANTTELLAWALAAETTNNTAAVGVTAATAEYTYQFIYIVCQYQVL